MERNNAWLRELIGRLSKARVPFVSHPPLVLKDSKRCRLIGVKRTSRAPWPSSAARLQRERRRIEAKRIPGNRCQRRANGSDLVDNTAWAARARRRRSPQLRRRSWAVMAGVEFHHDGKRLGLSISVRKVAK